MIASSSRPFNSLPEARFSGVGEFECNAGNVPSALWTRDPTADDWTALCAVPVILFNAWRQIRAPFAEILDTAPPPDIEAHVRQVAAQVPGIIDSKSASSGKSASDTTSIFMSLWTAI